jgi:hypothetical protein
MQGEQIVSEPQSNDLPQPAGVLFNSKAYDLIKFLALVLLPALGTLYFGVAAIWGLPHADDVVGTILVVDTFLGALIGISSSQYKNSDARFDGTIDVRPGEEPDTTEMNVRLSPQSIAGKDEVVVKVNKV